MNTTICPTILAVAKAEYDEQVTKLLPFAKRVQLDVMDGIFTKSSSVSLSEIDELPPFTTDFHLMYEQPEAYMTDILRLKPRLVIFHKESKCDAAVFIRSLHDNGMKAGIALLPDTEVSEISDVIADLDHVLIFAGTFGSFGGNANLALVKKASQIRALRNDIEIGWDGGANPSNVILIADGGIDVINVGGYIQNSQDPTSAYQDMVRASGS